jgi:hypothetical protein
MDELHFPPADTLREAVTRLRDDVKGFVALMLRMKSAAEERTGKDPLGRSETVRRNWGITRHRLRIRRRRRSA